MLRMMNCEALLTAGPYGTSPNAYQEGSAVRLVFYTAIEQKLGFMVCRVFPAQGGINPSYSTRNFSFRRYLQRKRPRTIQRLYHLWSSYLPYPMNLNFWARLPVSTSAVYIFPLESTARL